MPLKKGAARNNSAKTLVKVDVKSHGGGGRRSEGHVKCPTGKPVRTPAKVLKKATGYGGGAT